MTSEPKAAVISCRISWRYRAGLPQALRYRSESQEIYSPDIPWVSQTPSRSSHKLDVLIPLWADVCQPLTYSPDRPRFQRRKADDMVACGPDPLLR